MKKNVLITAAGTGTAFAIISRLRSTWGNNCRIVAMDTNCRHLTTSALLADRFIQSPPVKKQSFIEFVEDVISEESISTYIPILNDEFSIATTLKHKFPSVDVWVNPFAASLAIDKRKSSAWLALQGLPTPKVLDRTDIALDQDYFVKPINGYGSQSARPMCGEDILTFSEDFFSEYIVQQICHKPEISVDSFYDPRLETFIAVARERVETKAGVCTKARVFVDEGISTLAKRLSKCLEQDGLICFQMMKDKQNWLITDLNFRPGAGTAMTVAAGYDLISAAFAARWGDPYSSFLIGDLDKDGVYVTRQYAEFVMS